MRRYIFLMPGSVALLTICFVPGPMLSFWRLFLTGLWFVLCQIMFGCHECENIFCFLESSVYGLLPHFLVCIVQPSNEVLQHFPAEPVMRTSGFGLLFSSALATFGPFVYTDFE
ncbi:hypothetical protein BJV82DRAFT_636829 [Fennellomyces sp. T-0311]|nr:hypothetical protein BJV82DRAFT_636829 [Fennellomyces sp. T-0311]